MRDANVLLFIRRKTTFVALGDCAGLAGVVNGT